MNYVSQIYRVCPPLMLAIWLLAIGSAARAVTTSWNTNASVNFTNSANWDNGVPGSDDTAVFNRGFVAYEVHFPGGSVLDPPPNYPIEYLRVLTNEVSFVWLDTPFSTVPSLTVVNPDVSIVVGQDAGDVAILNMTLNSLSGANASIGRAPGAAGTLNVSGTFSMSGSLDVGDSGTGTLNVTAGGRVESFRGNLGHFANSQGHATVSGDNSQWTMTDILFIGNAGTGTLTIQNGGSVSASNCFIGNGTVTVTGVGSIWTNSFSLDVGNFGTGTLAIEAGGSVASGNDSIGDQSGSNGTVTVAGAGSTWTNSFGLTVGRDGMGTLTIADGGFVSNGSDSTISDDSLASAGSTVTVTGVDSRWISGGTLYVGRSGNGTLNITDGGVVSGGSAYVGRDTDTIARGWVTVDGVGSTWTISGDLAIGGNDLSTTLGTLIVSGGGGVSVGGLLVVEPAGIVAGNSTISATVVNRGVVSPGLNPGVLTGISPGALDVDGNYLQSAEGRLRLRLEGTTPGSDYDQLQVSGAVTLNGTLSVDLANSFAPSAGNVFDILDWGSLSGTFSTLQLPALASGLQWNTSQLYTSGVLAVIGIVPGDYNHNGTVDAADYAVWRDSLGSTTNLVANGNGNTVIDAGDYGVWKTNFGQTAGIGSFTIAAVPEPTTLILLMLAAAGWCIRKGLSRRRSQQLINA